MRHVFATLISLVIFTSVFLIGLLPRVLGIDVTQEEGGFSKVVNTPLEKEKGVSVLFFGDMMLDRHVALNMDRYGNEYPFLYTAELFKSADFVVANAEGVFSVNDSVTKGVEHAPLRFTFATSTLPQLYALGVSALSQANNHNADFGRSASTYSHDAIVGAGIKVFGDFWNEEVGPVYLEKEGQKIALIGFNEFSYTGTASVEKAIREAVEQGAFVVVFPHWGAEYSQDISTLQKTYAHRFIDSGADLVVGAHPHVVEPIEIYKGKAIFYSLGNFIFDQYQPHTQEALGIRVTLYKERTDFTVIPLTLSIGQAKVAEGEVRDTILNFLKTASSTSALVKESIDMGLFSLPEINTQNLIY